MLFGSFLITNIGKIYISKKKKVGTTLKKRIAIDMDQVLANLYKKLRVTSNEAFNENLSEEEFLNGSAYNLAPDKLKKLFQLMNEPDYFRDLELLDEKAVEVVEALHEHYEVFIATAAMDVPGSFNAKYDWLQQYFPFINIQNIVFCGNKGIINADYLIDDSPRQLQAFSGTGILFSMPYNEHVEGFERVYNWEEIRTYFAHEAQKVSK